MFTFKINWVKSIFCKSDIKDIIKYSETLPAHLFRNHRKQLYETIIFIHTQVIRMYAMKYNIIKNEISFWKNKDEERSNCNFPLYVEGVNCIEFSGIYGQMLIYSQMFYIILLVILKINHCEVSQMFINFVVKQEFPPNVHWFYIGSRKKWWSYAHAQECIMYYNSSLQPTPIL